jgi:hypothetical protein
MKAWCLELDGRRDRDECAKPTIGRVTGPAVGPVAVFSLVRFQEKEMRKAARRKYAEKVYKADITTLAPLDLPPPKQGSCSAVGWKIAPAKALCQMSK